MAKRRTPTVGTAPVLPRELLEPRNRDVRRAWFEHFGLHTQASQLEAKRRAYAVYGLDANGRDPDAPDPRLLLMNPDHYSTHMENN